jgi:hypothetical protein
MNNMFYENIIVSDYDKISESTINLFEKKLNVMFPKDYKKFILEYNGSSLYTKKIALFYKEHKIILSRFIPLREISQHIRDYTISKNTYNLYEKEKLILISYNSSELRESAFISLNENRFGFIYISSKNIDLIEGKNIINIQDLDINLVKVANSFIEFTEMFKEIDN